MKTYPISIGEIEGSTLGCAEYLSMIGNDTEYLEEIKEHVYQDTKEGKDGLDNEDSELDEEWNNFDKWDEEDWEEHWKKADEQRDGGYGNLTEPTDCNDCGNSYLGEDKKVQCFKGVEIDTKKPKSCPYFDEFI